MRPLVVLLFLVSCAAGHAPDAGDGCQSETASEMCSRLALCGNASGVDLCGNAVNVACATCADGGERDPACPSGRCKPPNVPSCQAGATWTDAGCVPVQIVDGGRNYGAECSGTPKCDTDGLIACAQSVSGGDGFCTNPCTPTASQVCSGEDVFCLTFPLLASDGGGIHACVPRGITPCSNDGDCSFGFHCRAFEMGALGSNPDFGACAR